MTYIPNVRSKVDELSAMFGKKRKNAYYEGNLNDLNKEVLRGYDWAVEEIESWFGMEKFDKCCGVKKKALERLEECLGYHMESNRNELVVSMLDNQPCEEVAQ